MQRILGPNIRLVSLAHVPRKGHQYLVTQPSSSKILVPIVRSMSSNSKGFDKKICATCGREISWRKKWEKNWDSIIYCSSACRSNKIKPGSLDEQFESKILDMLRELKGLETSGVKSQKFITCEDAEEAALSELPPQSVGEADPSGRDPAIQSPSTERKAPARTRERCRQAARRLASKGEIVITQDGKTVDPSFAKGVMELRLAV